jgi:hypothetical protein
VGQLEGCGGGVMELMERQGSLVETFEVCDETGVVNWEYQDCPSQILQGNSKAGRFGVGS